MIGPLAIRQMGSETERGAKALRLGYLDGLRGVAAFGVLLCHLAGSFFPVAVFGPAGGRTHTPLDIWLHGAPIVSLPLMGNFMVCIFYTLSGIVLSYPLLTRTSRGSFFLRVVRRYLRLAMPALAATLLAWLLFSVNALEVSSAVDLSGSNFLSGFWQGSPHISQAILEGTVGVFAGWEVHYDPVLWTMHTELLGSLLVFALLSVVKNPLHRYVLYIPLAMLLRSSYLLGFVGGMIVCETLVARPQRPPSRLHATALGVVALYGLALGSASSSSAAALPGFHRYLLPVANDRGGVLTANSVGAICVLVAIVRLPQLQGWMERPVLRTLGRISFGLYLVHFLVIGAVGTKLLVVLVPVLGYEAGALSAAAGVVAVTLAAAWLFTVLVDEPVTRILGRWPMSVESPARRGVPNRTCGKAPR